MTKKQKKHSKLKSLIFALTYPDYIKITLRAKIRVNSQFKEPKTGRFNKHNHCHLQPANPRAGKVMRKHPWDIIIKTLSIRAQLILKKIVLQELNLTKMPRVKWQQSNNCLSATIYKRIVNKPNIIKKIKKLLYKQLNKMVEEALFELITDYYKQFGVELTKEWVEIFLNKAEICTDWMCSKNLELSKNKAFIAKFQQTVHNEEVSFFLDGRKYIIPPEVKPGCMSYEGSNARKMLKGFFGDRRTLKLYIKSIDLKGCLNRLETVLNTKALKTILVNKQLKLFSEHPIKLSALLKILSRQHRSLIFKIINHQPIDKKPNYKRKVRLALNDLCGKHSSELRKQYEKWSEFSTSRTSSVSSGAKRRIRFLCGKKLLFRRTGTARYNIRKKWLNKHYS